MLLLNFQFNFLKLFEKVPSEVSYFFRCETCLLCSLFIFPFLNVLFLFLVLDIHFTMFTVPLYLLHNILFFLFQLLHNICPIYIFHVAITFSCCLINKQTPTPRGRNAEEEEVVWLTVYAFYKKSQKIVEIKLIIFFFIYVQFNWTKKY